MEYHEVEGEEDYEAEAEIENSELEREREREIEEEGEETFGPTSFRGIEDVEYTEQFVEYEGIEIKPEFSISIDPNSFGSTDVVTNPIAGPQPPLTTNYDIHKDNYLDNLVVPPPFKRTIESIDDRNRHIPGEIKVSKDGQLLKSYFEYEGFTGDLIEAYNNWVTHQLPKQFGSNVIKVPGDNVVKFLRVHYNRPTYTKTGSAYEVSRAEPLLPYMCRDQSYTYSAPTYVDMQLVDKNGTVLETSLMVPIGKIPVMLGSVLCHLYGTTEEQRLQMKECNKDPFGYFILKGTEKIVLIQEKLRVNRIFIFMKDENPVCKITCQTVKGSSIVQLSKSPNSGIRLSLRMFEKDEKNVLNTISVFQLYRILGVTDMSGIMDEVLQFVNPMWRKKVEFTLKATILETVGVADDINFISKLRNSSKMSYEFREHVILGLIHEELFPHMANETMFNKLHLLSLMVARYAECLTGLRSLDDRDNWGNKRLENAARSMEQLFNGMLKQLIEKTETELAKHKSNINLNQVIGALAKSNLTNDFVSAFNSTNWGVKNQYKKENLTEVLNRASPAALYGSVTKINTPVSRESKQPLMRNVALSQPGFVCSVHTPEGKSCGLVKNKASTCYISIERDDLLIHRYLRGYVALEKDEINSVVILLNGKFLGWGEGYKIKAMMQAYKLNGTIYRDISILLHTNDKILYINTDGARPTRPLLTINEEGRLVIEQKNLWGAKFDVLIKEGAVEYIDAFEQEYIRLAMSINDMTFKKAQLKQTFQDLSIHQDKYRYLTGLLSDETYDSLGPEFSLPKEERQALYDNLPEAFIRIDLNNDEVITDIKQSTDAELYNFFMNHVNEIKSEFTRISLIYSNQLKAQNFTHCEMDPNSQLGIVASLIPLSNHQEGPRNTLQCSMASQSLGLYHSNSAFRYDKTIKSLAYPTRPLFETQMYESIGMNDLPTGETIIVAIMIYTGYNQEDSIIINKQSIESGKLRPVVDKTYKTVEKSTAEIHEKITRPKSKNNNNAHLDENGLPKIGSIVKEGDIIIGKIQIKLNEGKKEEDASERIGVGDGGVVESVLVTTNSEGKRVIKVKVKDVRSLVVGDKVAFRYAQKATVGLIMDAADMPSTASGMRPDVIINPHCIPSRMTIGFLLEILASKAGALRGERINATNFNDFNNKTFQEILINYGFSATGEERMYSGISGQMLEASIFIGPCYLQSLKHHPKDKIYARSKGGIYKKVNHQPAAGRKVNGGLRIGEMENAAMVSHGAANTLIERLSISSDLYPSVYCSHCGTIATFIMSEQTYSCRTCGIDETNATPAHPNSENKLENFGVVNGPYSLHYLQLLLNSMGLRISLKFTQPQTE